MTVDIIVMKTRGISYLMWRFPEFCIGCGGKNVDDFTSGPYVRIYI